MRLLLTFALGSALMCSVASASEPVKDASADREAAKQLVANFDRCARERDLETFLSYALDDVVALGPGEPAVVGKVALRSWYQNFWGAFDVALVHRPIETHSFGDLVITRGDATGTIQPVRGGEVVQVDNKYLFVLKRQSDGSLKVWRAMFNTNGQAPEAAK